MGLDQTPGGWSTNHFPDMNSPPTLQLPCVNDSSDNKYGSRFDKISDAEIYRIGERTIQSNNKRVVFNVKGIPTASHRGLDDEK